MKTSQSILRSLSAALALGAILAPGLSWGQGVTTTYANGDLFIGFRQTGVAQTLAVKLGSATQFIPNTIAGGTAVPGSSFNVQFGQIPSGPNVGTPVFSLNADLAAVFGSNWFDNDLSDSTADVSWAVAGFTANAVDNNPIAGLNRRTSFLTIPRDDPQTPAAAPLNFSNSSFGTAFNSFANGGAGGAYAGRTSTVNSNAAFIGTASDSNNWNQRIGIAGSAFGSGVLGEQQFSGPNSGPTNSVFDLYVFPNTGSTLLTQATRLGSFSLNASGQLQYQVVPEPGSIALLGAGGTLVAFSRRRTRRS